MFYIITPHFNSPLFKKTYKSVISQTYTDFKWIIIDDHSDKDYLNELYGLTSNDKRISILKNTGKKGAGSARNTGLEHLINDSIVNKEAFITFIDADDEWDEEFLEKSMIALLNNNYKIVTMSYRMKSKNSVSNFITNGKFNVFKNSYRYNMACLTTSIKISNWSELDGIRFGLTAKGNDQPFFVMFLRKFGPGYAYKEILATYNVFHGKSISSNKFKMLTVRWRLLLDVYKFSKIKSFFVLIILIIFAANKYSIIFLKSILYR